MWPWNKISMIFFSPRKALYIKGPCWGQSRSLGLLLTQSDQDCRDIWPENRGLLDHVCSATQFCCELFFPRLGSVVLEVCGRFSQRSLKQCGSHRKRKGLGRSGWEYPRLPKTEQEDNITVELRHFWAEDSLLHKKKSHYESFWCCLSNSVPKLEHSSLLRNLTSLQNQTHQWNKAWFFDGVVAFLPSKDTIQDS